MVKHKISKLRAYIYIYNHQLSSVINDSQWSYILRWRYLSLFQNIFDPFQVFLSISYCRIIPPPLTFMPWKSAQKSMMMSILINLSTLYEEEIAHNHGDVYFDQFANTLAHDDHSMLQNKLLWMLLPWLKKISKYEVFECSKKSKISENSIVVWFGAKYPNFWIMCVRALFHHLFSWRLQNRLLWMFLLYWLKKFWNSNFLNAP